MTMLYKHKYFKDRYISVSITGKTVILTDLSTGQLGVISKTDLRQFYKPVKDTDTVEPTKYVKLTCEVCGLVVRGPSETEIVCDTCKTSLTSETDCEVL